MSRKNQKMKGVFSSGEDSDLSDNDSTLSMDTTLVEPKKSHKGTLHSTALHTSGSKSIKIKVAKQRASSSLASSARTSEDEEEEEEDELADTEEEEDELEDQDSDDESSRKPSTNGSAKKSQVKFNKMNAKKFADRLVSYDPVTIEMPDRTQIDKFLSWRENADTQQEELLVKYKNTSHYHAEWIARADLEEMNKANKQRIKRYLEKGVYETQWSADEPFNPAFNKIDRIIDEGEAGHDIFFLVKWCALTYDQSTWETKELVEELDPDKIDEFHARRVPDPAKSASSQGPFERPVTLNFKKLSESLSFKSGNMLRAYQLEGLNWLLYCYNNHQNCILADEMGLGKTIQSTSFLNHLYTQLGVKGPFLIVTPLSTIGNWEREIRTWTDMNVIVYHGRESARNLIVDTEYYYKDQNNYPIPGMYKFDVLLTTYEMAMSGLSHLKPIQWRVCVLDEAHKLKNKSSKITETMKQYKLDHRVLLTGTPLQNSLEELWSLLHFLEQDTFDDEKVFQLKYGSLTTAQDVEKLQNVLKPLMLRRLKEDVETSIPLKEETVIEVELTVMQKKWYKSILERNFSWLKQGTKTKNMPNLINTMMELRKCCIHPFLLKGAEERIYEEFDASTPEKHMTAVVQASGKMVLIDKLLKKLHAGGHKVLIFSQMTKCLDIIQDYLRFKNYGYERIDGSVRGDIRQGAIDRFCAPNSEAFVFLLCTRAGGVGINLTVADTVIIFDSDWNPQNDLQAQSRCHRIGQTKSVQIYRLITSNTYEKDMFERASMKLGLDKAILQRMDTNSAIEDPFGDAKNSSSLSKQEVETLLKKGAYGAFIDDDASKQFCEEDIEEILTRRTRVIRHENAEEKSSIFSKATFSTSNTADAVDLNDPDFWDKIAEKAELTIEEQNDFADELLMYEPRQRRQVQKFGFREDGDSEEEPSSNAFGGDYGKKADMPRFWSPTERARFERNMMLYGYGEWDKIKAVFGRRSIEDLKSIGQQLIKYCLKHYDQDADLLAGVKGMLVEEAEKEAQLEREARAANPDSTAAEPEEEEEKAPVSFDVPTVPYEGASPKVVVEFRSFLLDAPPEYAEHISRKSKTLLVRIYMMYVLREKIKPHKDMKMPNIPGNPLNDWWGEDEDRDLMMGVVKHGYGQYEKMRWDPELCFHTRKYADIMAYTEGAPPVMPLEEDEEEEDREASVADVDVTMEEEKDKADNDSLELNEEKPLESDSRMEQVEDGASSVAASVHIKDESIPATSHDAETTEDPVYRWPTPSELGVRARRVYGAIVRKMASDARKAAKKMEKDKARTGSNQGKNSRFSRDRELTKKDKNEFRKLIISFGVETSLEDPNVRIWDRFRELTKIDRTDSVMDEFYLKLMSLCEECVTKGEEAKTDYDRTAAPDAAPFNILMFRWDKEGDSISYDVAKRMLKRIEMMRRLRQDVLPHPNMEKNIRKIKRHQRSGLPDWWTHELDIAFLKGIARWGIIRTDTMIHDPTLPFNALHQAYLQERGLLEEQESTEPAKAADKEDRFWMRETVALRRFDALCDAVSGTLSEGRRRSLKNKDEESEYEGEGSSRKRKSDHRTESLGASPPKTKPKKRKGKKKSLLEDEEEEEEGEDDVGLDFDKPVRDEMDDMGNDTDDMLAMVTGNRRKRSHAEVSYLDATSSADEEGPDVPATTVKKIRATLSQPSTAPDSPEPSFHVGNWDEDIHSLNQKGSKLMQESDVKQPAQPTLSGVSPYPVSVPRTISMNGTPSAHYELPPLHPPRPPVTLMNALPLVAPVMIQPHTMASLPSPRLSQPVYSMHPSTLPPLSMVPVPISPRREFPSPTKEAFLTLPPNSDVPPSRMSIPPPYLPPPSS